MLARTLLAWYGKDRLRKWSAEKPGANGLTMTPVYGGSGVGDQLGLTLVEQVVTRLRVG
jgi:hypothetical protein